VIRASYYDGRTARRHAVELTVDAATAHIVGDGIDRCAPLHELRVSEPLGKAARLITFPDGAVCEVRELDALAQLLASTGHREGAVVRWQYNLRWVMAALALTVGLVAAAYAWGFPWLAEVVAARIPEAAAQRIGKETLAALDAMVFRPSELPPARQAQLARRFDAMVPPDGRMIDHHVLFRSAKGFGANALALPSGAIIVTDELVKLARDDDEIMGVLAHEAGHVRGRHGLRLMLESSIAGLIVTWYVGDVSSLLAGAPVALLQAKYSRELETQADDYAVRMLLANGVAPSRLADLLARMEALRSLRRQAAAASPGLPDYLASHPATEERIKALRDAQMP
jgi:Zn-dependent protease with chaperone function